MSYAQKMLYDRNKKQLAESKAERKVQMLEADIRILEEKSDQQIKEMELINWYTQTMEQGIDAQTAMKKFLEIKKKYEECQKQRMQE